MNPVLGSVPILFGVWGVSSKIFRTIRGRGFAQKIILLKLYFLEI